MACDSFFFLGRPGSKRVSGKVSWGSQPGEGSAVGATTHRSEMELSHQKREGRDLVWSIQGFLRTTYPSLTTFWAGRTWRGWFGYFYPKTGWSLPKLMQSSLLLCPSMGRDLEGSQRVPSLSVRPLSPLGSLCSALLLSPHLWGRAGPWARLRVLRWLRGRGRGGGYRDPLTCPQDPPKAFQVRADPP